MIDTVMLFTSPQTGDGFNPIFIGAIALFCLAAVIFLIFSGKGRK
jgi:LPXTG-motif cell wall-anchored protein